MRFCVLCSICWTYLSCDASSPLTALCCVSRLPSWSTILTFLTGMSGTPADTMCAIASDLAFVEHASRVEIDHDRGGREFLFTHEHGRLRNGEMHARRLHRRNRADRLFEFAFQRALVVDLLGELADAELLVVHQFEADRAVLRQALAREPQTRFVDLLRRHQDRAARIGDLVRNVALLERGNDCAAVAVGQVGEQHAVIRLARPHDEAGHDHRQERDGDDQRHARVRAELRQHRHALREAAEVRAAAEAGASPGATGLRAGQAHSGVGRDQGIVGRFHCVEALRNWLSSGRALFEAPNEDFSRLDYPQMKAS